MSKFKNMKEPEELLRLLESDDMSIRTGALKSLLDLKESRGMKHAVSMLSSKYGWVRREATIYLATMAEVDEVPALIKALNDENEDVVAYCVEGLGRICDERSIRPLVALFQRQLEKYKSMTDAGHLTFVALSKLNKKHDVSIFE